MCAIWFAFSSGLIGTNMPPPMAAEKNATTVSMLFGSNTPTRLKRCMPMPASPAAVLVTTPASSA